MLRGSHEDRTKADRQSGIMYPSPDRIIAFHTFAHKPFGMDYHKTPCYFKR